ncbi:hypothetical protein GCM10010145_33340 [Streptomyces ruber]|uniref:Non-ribosomal peptide synthetase n=2 Tax=Streptomyces TaxID=1883 RepID=A0A918BDA8_9ACTN|nr:condensation domain-containing protein [Streptomyces ruber]GGQ60557.1 hypothetical protein GCM10010145_33340 [Streptomyces ruber]
MTAAPERGLPLTAAQAGVWNLHSLDPSGTALNLAEYLEIHGEVRPGLLARALRRTADDAEALRTRIVDTPDGPRQFTVPLSAGDFPLRTADLRGEADPDAAALAWMERDLDRPFDLAAGPPFRHALLRVGEARWLWYQCVHHLVMDGFGYSLLARRTAEVYSALAAGRGPGPNPFGRLADLVADDLAYRSSEQYGIDRAHWIQALADRPAAPTAAGRYARPSRTSLRRGARVPDDVTARLRALAGELRATWAEVLIAAQALYVSRVTEDSDVVLGLPLMCRLGSVALRVPGMVRNILPLRLEVTPALTFATLTRQTVLGLRAARRHQRYPFHHLRRDLGLGDEGPPPVGPLFNVMPFDYGLSFAGAPAVPHNLSAGPTKDLTVHVYDRADGRGLRIDHDAHPALRTGDELGAHQEEFLALLTRIAHCDPHAPLSRLGTPDGDGSAHQNRDGNGDVNGDGNGDVNRGGNPGDIAAVTRIGPVDAGARRTPDAPALVHADLTLTYAELAERSHRLARRLAARGVGTGDLVALALPRSVPLILGVLAVLKAGGACLPLDPEYPAQRLARLLDDAGPVCVLTDSATAARLPDTAHPRLLLDATGLPDPPSADPPHAFAQRHRARVIHARAASAASGGPTGTVVPYPAVARPSR